jgi:hypothetical protein
MALKRPLLATAAAGVLCASNAAAAPLIAPPDVVERAAGVAVEGGLGGMGDGGFLLVHHKKKHKHPYWYKGGEGGEGGEGGPVIIPRPVVHYVPIIPTIIGGPISIVLEADLPFLVEFEPQIAVAPIGTVVPWSNPGTGHYGEVAVLDDGYDDASGLPCRTYRTTVVVDAEPQTATGTACREADGTWRIVN